MRARVLMVVLLAGCSRISVDRARYTCNPDGGQSQCPGEWQCLKDGFCADPAVGGAFLCAADSDCTASWQCLKDGICADPAVGGAWSCASNRDCTASWQCLKDGICADPAVGGPWSCASNRDCTANWQCLKERTCADPDAGGPWSCDQDTDCTAHWHCGREQRCYDLSDAGAVTCRRDAGDCALGWACGLDERCLDTSLPNGNRCDSDLDCFAQQRCSATRCITLGDEALRVSDGGPTFNRGVLPLKGARLLAGYTGLNRTVLAGVVGSRVVISDMRQDTGSPFTTQARFETFDPAPLEPISLAVIEDPSVDVYSVAIVGRDGGAWHFDRDDAGWRGTDLALGYPARGVRRFVPKNLRWGVFGDRAVSVGPNSNSMAPVPDAPSGITDVTMIQPGLDGLLIASTAAGGWTHDLTNGLVGDGGWQGALCTKAGPLEGIVMVRKVIDQTSSFVVVTTDGGSTSVTTYDAVPVQRPPAAPLDTCPVTTSGLVFVPNQQVITLALRDPTGVIARRDLNNNAELTGVGGTLADGTAGSQWSSNSPAFTMFSAPYGALWSNSNTEAMVALSAEGAVWLQNGETLLAQMPRAPPRVTLRSGLDLLVHPDPEQAVLSPPDSRFTCVQNRAGAACLQSFNAFWNSDGEAVRGHDDWSVLFNRNPTPLYAGSVLDADGQSLATQSVASVVETSGATSTVLTDGGTLLMTRTLDFVSFVEVPASRTMQPVLRFAISPLPRGNLTDLILSPPSAAPDARFAEAWALASGRVFRVHASTPALWRAEEVPLPTDVEVLRLWLEGSRARGGDRLGVVFALGARVALSQPLPLGEVAQTYASRCTNDFVLTDSGKLFQLTASGTGQLATWVQLTTPVRFEQLIEHGDELRGFDSTGRAWWFDGLRCAP